MIDAETLDRLAEAEAPVLSVYLSRPMQVNPSARLTDLLRPIREAAAEGDHRRGEGSPASGPVGDWS